MRAGVSILGIFVADTAYYARRLPQIGETISGSGFALGPGGKGSNQAVAAARAGGLVTFISKTGQDAFGDMADGTYTREGIKTKIERMSDVPTGAALIFINDTTGENAIIVYPGAAGTIGIDDVEGARAAIEQSAVFVTQLEQPADAALRGLQIAHNAGVTTIFNPAPAEAFPREAFALTAYIIPNETEAAAIVGFQIDTLESAALAGDRLIDMGARAAIITLGGRGVFYRSKDSAVHIPAISSGPVVDTTGAGDAFIGGFSAALSKGQEDVAAIRFGCAAAGIAVTRYGTAPAMPYLAEIETVLLRK